MTRNLMTANRWRGAIPLVALAFAMLAAAGCKDANDDAGSGGNGDGSGEAPLYAMMTQVYGTEDRTVYLSMSDTVDLKRVDLKQAREFPGVANFSAVGGRILVSSGQEPSITEFEISDDFEWTEGRTVDFANYPLMEGDFANFFYQYILDENAAYLAFETTKRIIWDPSEMKVVGTREDSELERRMDDLELGSGGNRNGVRFDGPVIQAFSYHDQDYLHYGDKSFAVAYDEDTHEESKVIELPCPGAEMTTVDEEGNTYFGTWSYHGTLALYGDGPAPCVARVRPDLTLDEDFTTDFTDLTDGRYVNNFRYIGNGKAIGNVLHHEELEADFGATYDPDVADVISSSGAHWRFWLFDLEAGEARPVDGIEVAVGSGAQFAVLDDRTFVFLPYDDWKRSAVYELDEDGEATKRFDVAGDVFKWVRVR